MPWEYAQSTGELRQNGQLIATGYSGAGAGRNNPAAEATENLGPIPAGRWTIGRPHNSATTGPGVLDLTPSGHNAHGRTAFQIHGDSRTRPGNASTGCIVLPPHIRQQIANSVDTVLIVIR